MTKFTKTAAACRPEPARPRPKLTIGMATYDDFDGTYFTATALRLYHAEVADQFDILVVDNNPGGAGATALRELEREVPGLRYLPVDDIRSPAVKDRIFREATADWVLCLDSHVLLAPGAIAHLLRFITHNPDCADLLQGPLLVPGGHFPSQVPGWSRETYGLWSWQDVVRGMPDLDGEPFEIEMQGLGLFACRRAVWPGYNPLFRGHGGEEGYLHKKFRSLGRRTLCLPGLAWQHRFIRPGGTPYRLTRGDRIRNFLIGWEELGLPTDEVVNYFREAYGSVATNAVQRIWAREKASPLAYFAVIAGLNPGRDEPAWRGLHEQVSPFDVEHRVRRIVLPAPETSTSGQEQPSPPAVEEPELASARYHRHLIARAANEGWPSLLVLDQDAVFAPGAAQTLPALVERLRTSPWQVVDLSSDLNGQTSPSVPAAAYHQRSYQSILAALPPDEAGLTAALAAGDGSLAGLLARVLGDGWQQVPAVARRPRELAA